MPLRELLEVLLGTEGKRRLRLRHMTNEELFKLYDNDLVLRLHNVKNLSDTRKILARYNQYLNNFPPSPELAKGFLAQYADRKPRTLYRYAQMIRVFMKWYGEPMEDFRIKVPKTLPPYTKDSEVERLLSAIGNKRSHKGCIVRDTLIVELAVKTGLRRSELANLEAKDIQPDFLVVRNGKGGKDRVIPLVVNIAKRLTNFTQGMKPEEKVFKLKAECISNKIRQFGKKAGLTGFHTHTMRHKFATDLLERGANIKQVQELLGHDNLATTEVYLSTTDQGKRDAINRLDEDKPDTEEQKTIETIRKRQVII
ncbi:tyrosine-type recombinase/integrase [Chloroflexota bacterium]